MNRRPSYVEQMNQFGRNGTPFLAVIPFDKRNGQVWKCEECENEDIFFTIDDSMDTYNTAHVEKPSFRISPPSFELYERQFNHVLHEIHHGNTYLLNLCSSTRINEDIELKEIYNNVRAKYRLYFKNKFVVFSPESFVKIAENTLTTFPMKGTIDATLQNAAETLLADEKERAEHYTIVDLLRNDVGIVCDRVEVKRFRYLEKIETSNGPILQMSSEIAGIISTKYRKALGDLFYALLPAGSITGAPKQKTIEIINRIEQYDRGYYTGIMVYFDGKNVDSSVLIRFIEKHADGNFYYRSGGGITFRSDVKKEYDELIKKVYLPIF